MESLPYLETDKNKQEEVGSIQVKERSSAVDKRASPYLEGNDTNGLVSSRIVEITYSFAFLMEK